MRYYLNISLESDICMGNGESKGNAIDRDICTTKEGIPYIPARRIKGCLRQTASFLRGHGYKNATASAVQKLFGDEYGTGGNLVIDDANIENLAGLKAAIEELKNNPSKKYLKHTVIPENMKKIYTAVRGQTRLENGIKVNNTLRFTRVLTKNNPVFNENETVCFRAPVYLEDESEEQLELLKACCKGTRHLGTSRNRGLGNVSISLCEMNQLQSERKTEDFEPADSCMYEMKYKIVLDSPVCVPVIEGIGTTIPARSVIGCLGGYYAKKQNGIDETFRHLFLDGTVMWSALTPVIDHEISAVVPTMLVKLKNDHGRIINCFAQKDTEWKKLKPKTMEAYFACPKKEQGEIVGYKVAGVETHTQYHNNMSKETLYMQDAIDEGYVYGGTVIFEGKYYKKIVELLTNADMRFGRSRNVQYSNCRVTEIEKPVELLAENRKIAEDEKLYVILKADMIINKGGIYLVDSNEIRKELAQVLNIEERGSKPDYIHYTVVGGYNNMWQMPKPQLPAVKAGSVFCFDVNSNSMVPGEFFIGELQQEGFGRCEVITESEMAKRTEIESVDVDRQQFATDQNVTKNIEEKLMELIVRELLLKYAKDFKRNGETNKLPVGRLRLMLSESDTYDTFLEGIGTMKTSDVSSESEGKKKLCKEFVHSFYGEEKVDWQRLLAESPQLYDTLKGDTALLENIEKKYWKLPLERKLHELHYDKEAR